MRKLADKRTADIRGLLVKHANIARIPEMLKNSKLLRSEVYDGSLDGLLDQDRTRSLLGCTVQLRSHLCARHALDLVQRSANYQLRGMRAAHGRAASECPEPHIFDRVILHLNLELDHIPTRCLAD